VNTKRVLDQLPQVLLLLEDIADALSCFEEDTASNAINQTNDFYDENNNKPTHKQ
jgi:hypothetical protein